VSYDVARGPVLTVLNAGTDSTAAKVHGTLSDSAQACIYSPASLNAGVFIIQVTPDEPDAVSPAPVWYTHPTAVPAAGAMAILSTVGMIGIRIHATTPPNADTTFKFAKQYLDDSDF